MEQKSETHQTVAERSREAPLEEMRAEARYRRERLALYRARMYGGRAKSLSKLRDLQRSSDGAATRLRRAENSAFRVPSERPQR